ncbi:Nlp/P60 [Candidatus Koribacter versatilis Ellin345]|uniref:Nlp/P60 n=1 Tax=Koribacter versatilis (strain Ellin345) TaxID=204669 RepID=Q1IJ93_KORVE|nr:C40 family peptidase [Candidatus Koribacter versatilis]ABF43057.1 Nlp/P60 [Candidatus Koribacter versatilis Ellin345]
MDTRNCKLLTSFVLALSAFALGGGPAPDRVVVVPVANMYSSPSASSDVVSQAILGSNVVTLQKKGKWVKAQTSDQYTGWIEKRALRDAKNSSYATTGDTVQVTSLFANVYRETDVTAHAPIVTLPFESRVELIGHGSNDNGRWLQIRLPDKQTGWIQSGDVSANPKILTIPESIELAKRFLGIPYLWGGRSSFGYDCSGFTQMLVRSRGIYMPRDADVQASWTGVMPVDRKDLQAGDLLFFGSSPQKITHTGMYIGNGEFIHDTTNTHPVVQISQIDEEPWTHLLVASRRVK